MHHSPSQLGSHSQTLWPLGHQHGGFAPAAQYTSGPSLPVSGAAGLQYGRHAPASPCHQLRRKMAEMDSLLSGIGCPPL